MRLRINSISLIGANREFFFNSGLNIIAGPITTGKSTLQKCLRGLLGSGLNNFPSEVRQSVTNLAGELLIIEESYSVIRPFVTTVDARVDIAGPSETLRIPALSSKNSNEMTYRHWLLEKLGLPKLDVPRAPTQAESELSPVTINDYLMYCHLKQDEIDNSIFGHTDYSKNIKRKYVFDIVYGKYNIQAARLHDELRDASNELRRLKNQTITIEEFLSGTPLSNRAGIEKEIRDTQTAIQSLENETVLVSEESYSKSDTLRLRSLIQDIENDISNLEKKLRFENESLEQKKRLLSQLKVQSNRLTRSIVAGSYLLDYDFLMCPRCGSSVQPNRTSEETCYLCLQTPSAVSITRNDLVKEQDRLEAQINETYELILMHEQSINDFTKLVDAEASERNRLSLELDYLTRVFISDRASQIANYAKRRAEYQEKLQRLNDYLQLLNRRSASQSKIAELEAKVEDIEAAIDAAMSSSDGFEEKFHYLEDQFRYLLKQFQAPEFSNPGHTGIDKKTYLPLVDGRRFDELSSPGLITIVNVAHIIAHQLTALHFNLPLPNLLMIDGLSGNMGYEDLDLHRIEAIYNYIVKLAKSNKDKLQIFLIDNTVPPFAREHVRLHLTEENKLIPEDVL